jgi:asparagine synthase (glutamine-hydrolysing)
MVTWSKSDDRFINDSMNLMRHRGPENESQLTKAPVTLGHQRLKIIDLSDAANQPFNFETSSFVFNGEIYNYRELAKNLPQDITLKTSSDTEVLAVLLTRLGIKALNSFNGMFAIAWHDVKNDELVLIRDRFGVKPLYYTECDGNFYFSSELKPLIKKTGSSEFNQRFLSNFVISTTSDVDEQTPIEGIFQIKPGNFVRVHLKNRKPPRQERWYHFNDASTGYNFSSFNGFTKQLEDLLTDSIALRFRSDVPVGLTLSGGLDSSTIYTLAKENLNLDPLCFTMAHPNAATDESDLVGRLTAEYRDKAVFIEDRGRYTISDLRESLYFLEFPTWNNSCLAYDAIYKAISSHNIKVIIEGHGSDEQLGGYPYMVSNAYFSFLKRHKFFKAYMAKKVYQQTLNADIGEHQSESRNWFWQDFIKPLFRNIFRGQSGLEAQDFDASLQESFDRTILPFALRAFDRLTMKSTIESRAPFMDYRIVEFLRAAPIDYKLNSLGTKAPLRAILKNHKKDYIYKQKRKMGFAANCPAFYGNNNRSSITDLLRSSPYLRNRPELREPALITLAGDSINWNNMNTVWKALSLALTQEIFSDVAK